MENRPVWRRPPTATLRRDHDDSPEREAFCGRYHHVKKWPPAAVARQLNINPVTVMRVLAQVGLRGSGWGIEISRDLTKVQHEAAFSPRQK